MSLIELRKAVGMVFQRPNPLPISVYENVVFGLRIHSPRSDLKRADLDEAVEKALTEVGLWNDLKDRLSARATTLQLEQQQKLCIARLLPLKPEVILMDEPCSALDVEGTRAIEELMFELKGRYTIVIVTHNMAQARRASDECIFMLLGRVVEHARTEDLFLNPRNPKTRSTSKGATGRGSGSGVRKGTLPRLRSISLGVPRASHLPPVSFHVVLPGVASLNWSLTRLLVSIRLEKLECLLHGPFRASGC